MKLSIYFNTLKTIIDCKCGLRCKHIFEFVKSLLEFAPWTRFELPGLAEQVIDLLDLRKNLKIPKKFIIYSRLLL